MHHACGVDAELSIELVGDEPTGLDQAAHRPGGHAEEERHFSYLQKAREPFRARGSPSRLLIPRRRLALRATRVCLCGRALAVLVCSAGWQTVWI
jgi:hypothetical protein